MIHVLPTLSWFYECLSWMPQIFKFSGTLKFNVLTIHSACYLWYISNVHTSAVQEPGYLDISRQIISTQILSTWIISRQILSTQISSKLILSRLTNPKTNTSSRTALLNETKAKFHIWPQIFRYKVRCTHHCSIIESITF